MLKSETFNMFLGFVYLFVCLFIFCLFFCLFLHSYINKKKQPYSMSLNYTGLQNDSEEKSHSKLGIFFCKSIFQIRCQLRYYHIEVILRLSKWQWGEESFQVFFCKGFFRYSHIVVILMYSSTVVSSTWNDIPFETTSTGIIA